MKLFPLRFFSIKTFHYLENGILTVSTLPLYTQLPALSPHMQVWGFHKDLAGL